MSVQGVSVHVKRISFDWKIEYFKYVIYEEPLKTQEFPLGPELKINLLLKIVSNQPTLFFYENTFEEADINIHCRVYLIDKRGRECYPKISTLNFKLLEVVRFSSWTWNEIMECTGPEDSVIIRCSLLVPKGRSQVTENKGIWSFGTSMNSGYKENTVEQITQTEEQDFVERKENFLVTLQTDLQNMYDKKTETDCILKTGERKFPAHRALLSTRSTVFAAMFHHNTRESQNGEVEISDVQADILDSLLHFVYTGKIRGLTTASVVEMYAAADKYAILGLRSACLAFLKCNLTIDNVFDVAYLAHIHAEELLQKNVRRFIEENLEEVLESDRWKTFLENTPILANKILAAAFLACKKRKVEKK